MTEEIMYRIINGRLADFKGLSLKGTFPVSEELANKVFEIFLKNYEEDEPSSDDGDSFKMILSGLDRKDIRLSFQEGKINFHLDLRKY